MKRFFQLFVPKSLIGRYIFVSSILFIILIFMAVIGWHAAQQGVKKHHQHMSVLGDLESSIHNYSVKYQAVKYTALEFIIQPDSTHYDSYKETITKFRKSFIVLGDAYQRHSGGKVSQQFSQLKFANNALHIELLKIISVRQDAEQTFPFTTSMLNLANDNSEILSLMDRVIASDIYQDERLPEKFKFILTDTQYTFARLMADYRLLVSVRFGIFTGDWQQAYTHRVNNIDIIVKKIEENLALLEQYQSEYELPFVVTHDMKLFYSMTNNSISSYQKAIALLSAPNWRQDLVLLREKLQPAFNELDKSLQLLHLKEEKIWSESMGELTEVANDLSDSLWLLLIICSALVVFGYFMFSKIILIPINHVAQALKNEAAGNVTTFESYSSAAEIQNLTSAFHEMRRQVNSRQKRLVNILDNAAEAIITIDSSGLIETFNAAAESLFNYRASEVLGKNVIMLISEDERIYYQALFQKYKDTDNFKVLCKNNILLPVSVKISRTVIDGNVLYTGLVIDISERLANELERQQHQSEMAHVGRLSIMGEMAAGIAHEINQPLAAMSLYLQGSLRCCDPEADSCKDVIKAVKSAIGQVDRASNIVRKMRGFAHRETFKHETVDINELIRKSVELVLISQSSISPQPKLRLNKTPIMVKVDALQIEQVLVNLIRNAFDAQLNLQSSARSLKITSEVDAKGYALVTVIDGGEGVAAENVDKIFNTYFTTKGDGLGMGLSICRSIIEEHNGVLWYVPGAEKGSQFCFIIPTENI